MTAHQGGVHMHMTPQGWIGPVCGPVDQVKGTRDRMSWGARGAPPLLIKIAPDLTELDKRDIAAVALACHVDGLIVSNTTIQRPGAAQGGGRLLCSCGSSPWLVCPML